MNRFRSSAIVLGGVLLVVVGGGGAVAIGSGDDSPPKEASTVTAVANPSIAQGASQGGRIAQPPKSPAKGSLGLLRQASTSSDTVPSGILLPKSELPIADLAAARLIPTAAGAPPRWIVPTGDGLVAFLSSTGGSVSPLSDVLAGKQVHLDEILPGDPAGIVLTGIAPDGVSHVTVTTGVGTKTLDVAGNVYSARFERSKNDLPHSVSWTDSSGEHSVDVPYSPDVLQTPRTP